MAERAGVLTHPKKLANQMISANQRMHGNEGQKGIHHSNVLNSLGALCKLITLITLSVYLPNGVSCFRLNAMNLKIIIIQYLPQQILFQHNFAVPH